MRDPSGWDKAAHEVEKKKAYGGTMSQEMVYPAMHGLLGDLKGLNVLDLACGQGFFTRTLAKKGAKVVAVEISEGMLGRAAEAEERERLGIRYLRMDATKLEGIRAGSFDAVSCNMALHDIEHANLAMKESFRALRRGGSFVFSILHPLMDSVRPGDYGRDSKGRFVKVRLYGRQYALPHRTYGRFGVKMYHRPIGYYVEGLADAGFVISGFREIPLRHAQGLDGLARFVAFGINSVFPGLLDTPLRHKPITDRRKLEFAENFPLILAVRARKP